MELNISPDKVIGLGQLERDKLKKLIEVYNYHKSKN